MRRFGRPLAFVTFGCACRLHTFNVLFGSHIQYCRLSGIDMSLVAWTSGLSNNCRTCLTYHCFEVFYFSWLDFFFFPFLCGRNILGVFRLWLSELFWPVRCGEVLLLLELLLQAHQLQLGENSAAASGLFQARRAALRLRLAADAVWRLAGWGFGAPRKLRGNQRQVRVDCARRSRPRQVGGHVGRLPCDDWDEWVGTQWWRAWKTCQKKKKKNLWNDINHPPEGLTCAFLFNIDRL